MAGPIFIFFKDFAQIWLADHKTATHTNNAVVLGKMISYVLFYGADQLLTRYFCRGELFVSRLPGGSQKTGNTVPLVGGIAKSHVKCLQRSKGGRLLQATLAVPLGS